MIDESPYALFVEELSEVVRRWADKPMDDQLTNGEVVGGIEIVKFNYLISQAADDDEEEEEWA